LVVNFYNNEPRVVELLKLYAYMLFLRVQYYKWQLIGAYKEDIMPQASQTLVNRNISVIDPASGELHRTSIRLEQIEWVALRNICAEESISINEFCCRANRDAHRKEHSRTSRIRSAILSHYLDRERRLDS
jgi:predicted DNA-binding ribbon-helix-helix protein|tara:strand:+ start:191 stop:583 length:393 start_codon:yes stop_codon:yes gene_type:complete